MSGNKTKSKWRQTLVNTTAASTLLAGASPAIADIAPPPIPDVQPFMNAYDPVSGPEAELAEMGSPMVHIGGMRGMMNLSRDNIFHKLASMPEEERILRVSVFTQESIPDVIGKYDVKESEYAPLSETAIASIEAMLDQFTSITGIKTEIVPNDLNAMLHIGAFNNNRIDRQYQERATNPNIIVADGFAAAGDKLIVLNQGADERVSFQTAWHELGHFLGESHSPDKHGTLGGWHVAGGTSFNQLSQQQQRAISVMTYYSYLNGPGPADIYLIHEAMKEAGLTPPEADIDQTLLASRMFQGELGRSLPAETVRVQSGSRLEGTNQSDLLVTEAGLCGTTRFELYKGSDLYCIVEGDYSHVTTGAGNDFVLASRLKDQTISLGEGEKSIAILDKDSGEKTIRYDTQGEQGSNTLVFSDDMLRQGTVSARQDGDSIILDFMHEGVCTTRVTLVDQLKEDKEPLINSIKVIFTLPSYTRHPVEIDIRQARSPKDFETLFNEQVGIYREEAEALFRSKFNSEAEYQQYLSKSDPKKAPGEFMRNAIVGWEAERWQAKDGTQYVTFRPTGNEDNKKPLPIVRKKEELATRHREETSASWIERIRDGATGKDGDEPSTSHIR